MATGIYVVHVCRCGFLSLVECSMSVGGWCCVATQCEKHSTQWRWHMLMAVWFAVLWRRGAGRSPPHVSLAGKDIGVCTQRQTAQAAAAGLSCRGGKGGADVCKGPSPPPCVDTTIFRNGGRVVRRGLKRRAPRLRPWVHAGAHGGDPPELSLSLHIHIYHTLTHSLSLSV